MTTNTDSPSMYDRLNETRERLQQLTSRRGAHGLAAANGDQDARRELATVVSQVQAAEIEISILEDADRVERAQNGAEASRSRQEARIAAGARAVEIAGEIDATVRQARRAKAEHDRLTAIAHEKGIELRRKLREAVENFSTEVATHGELDALCRDALSDHELEVGLRSIRRQAESRHQDAISNAARAAA